MSEQRNQQTSEQLRNEGLEFLPSGIEVNMERPTTEAAGIPAAPVVVRPAGYDPSVYERGLVAFERDLPELLKTHFGQWVIYHGDHRFGPAETFQELDSACQQKRIPIGEQVVRMIEPEVEPEMSF
jgi:hypothetical protein